MIVVLSFKRHEQGTDPVIDWLLYYKAPFIKITLEDILENKNHALELDLSQQKLVIDGKNRIDDVNVIWYRRFLHSYIINDKNTTNTWPSSQLQSEVHHEIERMVKYLHWFFRDKVWLPHPGAANVNKLEVLDRAQSVGLSVPVSKLINNKKSLKKFYSKSLSGIVCKPIHHSSYYTLGHYSYILHVHAMTMEEIDALPDFFHPTLFQEKADARYEVRVFYLDRQFYATAMLIDIGREVDVKQSFDDDGINFVPYQLPVTIQEKIRRLMDDLNLNTGSIDIIRTKKGEYVFLEVNPVGQYNAPSNYCNYQVEKLMAEWLIKHDK